jgi:hypothetical protein
MTARMSYMSRTWSRSSGATCSPRPGASRSTPRLRSTSSACCTGWRDTPSSWAICSWMTRAPGGSLPDAISARIASCTSSTSFGCAARTFMG